MSRIPTIPDFSESIISITAALRTIKMGLEILGGLRPGGESQGAPLIYVQGGQPRIAMDTSRRTGDLWLDTDDDSLRYWDGKGWRGLTGASVVRTYTQAIAPTTGLRKGDQWINTGTNVLSYWTGKVWQAMA